ncbi:hypothetical protein H6785_02740 [Candidatus Nomurabacteria bacterium]|nr:hypothetical protein [Candidatus Nomurabacteria bacterium]
MPSLLQNKYVRFAGIGILLLIGLVIFWGIVNLFSSSTGLNDGSFDSYDYNAVSPTAPSYAGKMAVTEEMGLSDRDAMYYPPVPAPNGYTSELETYETTSYLVSGKTKQFNEFCNTIKNLKADTEIHFKSLNESTNNCNSIFYVVENKSENVLGTLAGYQGVEYTRNTSSVTKHKQQLQSQTSILQQQLASVERSLTTAETQLNNLTDFYLTSDDVATLSKRVNESLALIDQLTQRKISLTSQLNNLYQQSADLDERLGVVEFSVNVSRSNPIFLNKDSQKWERAWDELRDAYTDTLIGLSAFFGIFILWTLRLAIYGIVLLLLARGLWKLIKLLWNK